MKINDLKEVAPLQATTTSSPVVRNREDKVSLDRTQALAATVTRAKATAGAGRAAELAAIDARIRNGTFQPSPQQIADRMISAAEIDAQLKKLLE